MAFKLFGKNIDPACTYCKKGKLTGGKSMVLCPKKGVVSLGYSCKSFEYDPLKREPKKILILPEYDSKDFEI